MLPTWFFGYDIILQLFFLIISLITAILALKVYGISSNRLARYFGYGFLLISGAYLMQLIFNSLVYCAISGSFCQSALSIYTASLATVGTYLYMLFMTAGLVFILFVSLKSEKIRTLWLLLIASLTAIFLGQDPAYNFYLLSSIYFAFIAWHFVENYLNNRQTKTLVIALAFLFLWFGTFHFLISVNHELFYIIGEILDFFAYLMILLNWRLLKK